MSMTQGGLMAVTVIGEDRPRIVAAVARVLYESGCNLEDVSSTILRGHFSMVLIVRAPEALGAEELESQMRDIVKDLGLGIAVRRVDDAPLQVNPPTHMVSVYGADRPGIVYRVAETLANEDVNITDLTSRVIGPGDAPIYALMLEVASTDDRRLKEALRSVSENLEIDVSVRALDADVL